MSWLMRYGFIIYGLLWAQTNVGIGTGNPTHRLHLGTGTLRVEDLSGPGTSLAQTSSTGVLGRFTDPTSAAQILRGNATWGADVSDWKITGNSGTDPSTHFVGTTDAQDFRIGVNATTRWRILASDGRHWVGQNSTATLSNAQVSVQAPSGWIAVYGQVTGGDRPAVRGTSGGGSGPAVGGISTATDGWGAIGIGGNATLPSTMPTNGGGAYGVAPVAGVVGAFTEANSDSRAGGAFAVRDGIGAYNWVYIAGQESGNARKIHGAGTASTNIRDPQSGRYHTLFCPEAPEALFWDQGDFLLTSQKVFIPFDPLLAQHILPPYSVYLQPWGPIQVSVTQITPEGFLVEAEKAPDHPIRVSYLLQARNAYANERLPEVNPHRYFTPFQPVTTYLTPQELKNPK
jgi:hypothetical protein